MTCVNFSTFCVFIIDFFFPQRLLALNRRFYFMYLCIPSISLSLFYTAVRKVCVRMCMSALYIYLFIANKSKCISINKYWFGTKTNEPTKRVRKKIQHTNTHEKKYLRLITTTAAKKTLWFLIWFVSMCFDISFLLIVMDKKNIKIISILVSNSMSVNRTPLQVYYANWKLRERVSSLYFNHHTLRHTENNFVDFVHIFTPRPAKQFAHIKFQ